MAKTKKVLTVSLTLLAVGGLGIAYAYSRARIVNRKTKNLSIRLI